MAHIEALPVHFLALISRERSFSAQLQVPVLGDLLGFREAFFFGADAPILARQIGGALPQTAIGTLVDVPIEDQTKSPLLQCRLCLVLLTGERTKGGSEDAAAEAIVAE